MDVETLKESSDNSLYFLRSGSLPIYDNEGIIWNKSST